VKRKPEKKKSGLYGIGTLDLYDTGAALVSHHYLKESRDRTGMRALTLQAFPDSWKQEMEIFSMCTQRPFG